MDPFIEVIVIFLLRSRATIFNMDRIIGSGALCKIVTEHLAYIFTGLAYLNRYTFNNIKGYLQKIITLCAQYQKLIPNFCVNFGTIFFHIKFSMLLLLY